jgi:uncharacterized protein (DUF736 family)
MTQIGEFTRTPDGFVGRVHTLSLDVELRLVPAEIDAEKAPDYRVHLGADGEGPEVGAGWKRTGERAGPYVSLVLDDPSFAQPIHANLFQAGRDDGAFHLQWSPPSRRRETA